MMALSTIDCQQKMTPGLHPSLIAGSIDRGHERDRTVRAASPQGTVAGGACHGQHADLAPHLQTDLVVAAPVDPAIQT